MNISGNLKSAASWCLGLNNVESVIKVCKGTYFFNTNDHKQPTYTDKAVQLAEECGKIFLKYTVMGGAISQPLFDREIITPAKPNTLTGLLQEAIKLPYCAAKSALDMHSLYCEPLEYCGLYDDVKEMPNAPTGATVTIEIPSQLNRTRFFIGIVLLDQFARANNTQERIRAVSMIALGLMASYNNLI